MIGRLFHLLALFALTLMPFGMGAAPASAAAPAAQAQMHMAPSGHCGGDQTDKGSPKLVGTHCGGTCSALPGLACPVLAEALPPAPLQSPAFYPALHGLSPAPSIPPPRTV